jgi:hypothetical protein
LYFIEDGSESYVEFVGMTRVRRGTTILDENNLAEKIINDIVAMDAAFDPSKLPDLSVGKTQIIHFSYIPTLLVSN